MIHYEISRTVLKKQLHSILICTMTGYCGTACT